MRCATLDTIVASVPKASCKAEVLVGVAVDAGKEASECVSDCDCAVVRLQLAGRGCVLDAREASGVAT
jgi:hypothetical protein